MPNARPGKTDFYKLCENCNAVPVYCSLLSDQLTPVSAFQRLVNHGEHAFLLESVVGGEKIARYSFLSTSPMATVSARDRRTHITTPEGSRVIDDADPLEQLESLLGQYRTAHPVELPRFLGGAVGYAGYDIARHYERLGSSPPDDRELPDLQFGIYDRMVIFDHVRKLIIVVAYAHVGDGIDLDVAYDTARERIQEIIDKLGDVEPGPLKPLMDSSADAVSYGSNMTTQQFEEAVDTCKDGVVPRGGFEPPTP